MSYDAIYNGVRDSFGWSADVHFKDAWVAVENTAKEYARPSIMLKVEVNYEPQGWLAAYSGVSVAGNTPDEAMRKFDNIWLNGVNSGLNPVS